MGHMPRPPIVACLGMAWWKRQRIRVFFQQPHRPKPRFFWRASRALAYAQAHKGALAVWATRVTPLLQQKAQQKGIPLLHIEDGFIRSLGLGSGFLPPCSIIADTQGAYVDPSQPSDLEKLLNHAHVPPELRDRTQKLVATLRRLHISKYAAGTSPTPHSSHPSQRRHHPILLVPGQVAGDLSVVRGGGTITNNLDLLQDVRRRNPDAWILYRPHPDVEAGHRPGALSEAAIQRYADEIHRGGTMSQLLEDIDEVHTLTSLTGFEALLRGKNVTTYGAPFYAGWGLTTHLGPNLPRRQRLLDRLELAAITLILYPLYVNPATERRCEIEELLSCFNNRTLWKPTIIMRLREKQGQIRRTLSRFFA